MGLPLFVVPSEPEVDSKSTEKLAAIPRSTIRRATIRPRRSDGEARRRRILGLVERASPEVYVINDAESMAPRPPVLDSYRAQRALDERRRDRESVQEMERQRHTPDPAGRMMPPVPESGDFASIAADNAYLRRVRARHEARRVARRVPAPYPYDTEERAAANRMFATDFTSRTTDADTAPSFRAPPTIASLQERVDYLNARSNRLLRETTLDGLGDRNRSISPPGDGWYREINPETRRDNHEIVLPFNEDTSDEGGAWDTLLTSITPDPQPPSAGSSFASSSAAAATSASTTGPPSASTSMTSVGGTQDPLPCDITDGSESEEEDMYELPNFANNRASGDRFWRTYATVVTAGPNRDPRPGVDAEHLDGMHRIISRLASRDEIPENWWASAGLSRILRREPAA